MRLRLGWVGAALGLVAVAIVFVVSSGGEDGPEQQLRKPRRGSESQAEAARPAAAVEKPSSVVESALRPQEEGQELEAIVAQRVGAPPAEAKPMSAPVEPPTSQFQPITGTVPASREGLRREVMGERTDPVTGMVAGPELDRSAAEDDLSKVPEGEARLQGVVLQPNGQPVTGMEIRLRPLRRNRVAADARTDEAGGYSMTIPAGRYKLDIGSANTPLAFAPDLLRLDPGENRYDLHSPDLGAIRVMVGAETGGAPVEGAELVAKERYGREWKATTGPDGRAEFRNLPVGSYRVLLMARHRRVAEQFQMLFARGNPEVRLSMPEMPGDSK